MKHESSHQVQIPHWGWWLSILFGMTLLGVLALSAPAYLWWAKHVTTLFSKFFLQVLFAAACLTHVAEALVALHLCRRGPEGIPRWGWFVQTLILGFPSLGLLQKQMKEFTNE